MTDETEDRHESGNQPRSTPRKVNPDGGSIKQTILRDEIARHMRNEMLTCSVNHFLEELAPFSPDTQWISNAYEHLKKARLLGTPAETALPVEEPQRRSTRNSIWAGFEAGTEGMTHEVDPENANMVQWEAYRDREPGQMENTEMSTFRPLEQIVEALHDCGDPSRVRKRQSNGYHYKDCPNLEMKSEILGGNFKIDAAIANTEIYKVKGKNKGKNKGKEKEKEKEKDVPWAAAQTAVVMEFKKMKTAEVVYENRKQLVAAANHVMNDDPRRDWMYGITIENTDMSLWYFSRSYSIKSAPFNFTKDFKTFIRVFLSFLYATDEELGHDPSIYRKYFDEKWCYVYKLATEEGPKYYRTVELLYNPRTYCITGRKSRVWKVIEVMGENNLAPKLGEREVVLKDCWVDQGSLSEKEIQEKIFKQLKDVKEADYAWAPLGLRDRLKAGLACPGKYFMKVLWDSKERSNKARPKSNPDPNLLSLSDESVAANAQKVISSTQTPPPTAYPSPYTSNTLTPVPTMGEAYPVQRSYKVKQHYRLVYADVGESLAYSKRLSDAVTAFEDIFIALTLLFLAGWVHRDVSEGNIILVRGKNGVGAKLSDLEYAQSFIQEDEAVSGDPKTGTPYFMPIEIHKGAFIFDKRSKKPDFSFMRMNWKPNLQQPQTTSPPLRHNYAHDLESLWWIIVWILLVRIKGAKWFYKLIFTVHGSPTHHRESFFKKGGTLHDYPEGFIHETLCGCRAHTFLAIYSAELGEFYETGKRQDPVSYRNIYCSVWDPMEVFIHNVAGISMELEDPSKRPPPSPVWIDSQEYGKRSRPADNDAPDRELDAEAGSSRKRQKSGGDVLIHTDEEDMSEENAVQDMARIVRQDSNPRIRTAWD